MQLAAPNVDAQRAARALYWQGWAVTDIAAHLHQPRTTVQSWKDRGAWDDAPVIQRVETTIEARMVQLVAKEAKTGGDFKEIDLLGRQIERMARVRRYQAEGGHEGDLNPQISARGRKARAVQKARRNDYSPEQAKRLQDAFRDSLFDYQRVWHKAGLAHRIRNILKSRQIGATWYFAHEALVDAIATERNQIVLSASKAQAHVFKQYAVQFARDAAEIELTGDPIILPNNATLYFLGTNSKTAQSYHGNLYFDEYFWTHNFAELRKVASGMAIHKRWRQTYFSTPSSMLHQAFTFWTGDRYNKGRAKDQRVEIDVSHAALRDGVLCADGQWRQIVTVEDAVAGGCDLFDIEQLRLEYGAEEFSNLLMCMFIDDGASVFPLTTMQRCLLDAWEVWTDFKPFASRPLGAKPVWIGYDPSLTGDSAGCVVIAPPLVRGGKFRALERFQFRGLDFQAQAEAIRKLTERYAVAYIGIDATGVGQGVFQLVKQFFPAAEAISYSPEVKSRLVLKALDVISHGRLEFDNGWTDLVHAFLAIRKTTTASGRQVTFDATRSDDTGHADLAWATMHALGHEPLEGATATNSSILEIY